MVALASDRVDRSGTRPYDPARMPIVPLALRRDPLDALAALAADEPGAFLLDVPDSERPVTLLGCAPVDEARIAADDPAPLATIARIVGAAPPLDASLPFPLAGGTIGYLAYEVGAPRADVRDVLPVATLRRYDPVVAFDRARRQYHLVSSDARTARAPWLERLKAPVPAWTGPIGTAPLRARWSAAAYRDAVARIRAYLVAGDVYQVNLTQPYDAPLAAPAWALAVRLARVHPVPYRAYLDLGDAQIVMNSPELFLRRRGTRVETRPIKGTRPRGDGASADAALAAELLADAKERAEHVMIVDLERNDLGRVAETGSVRVDEYARVDTHPTVHHLVSTVSGTVRRDVDLAALLAATFPGGSITGAPKRRATEIIRELEPWPRGPYTGAVGLLDPRGDLELALAIRTAVVANASVRWSAGGGIVADSDPARELAECGLKTAALRLALGEPSVGALELCSSG